MTKLQELSARHFVETLSLVGNVDADVDAVQAVTRWNEAMCEPLDPKVAKYAKAVSRLLQGEAAMFYHAVEYKDVSSLRGMPIMDAFQVTLPEGGGAEDWEIFRTLSKLAQTACNTSPPSVPTLEAIRSNIEQHKTAKERRVGEKSSSSMHQAFQTCLLTLSDLLVDTEVARSLRKRVEQLDDAACKEASAAWSAALTVDMQAAIQSKDRSKLEGCDFGVLTKEEQRSLLRTLDSGATEAWGTLESMNSFSQVSNHIPSGMEKIEMTAQRLAADIGSGSQNLQNLDLAKIGESVLSQCSTEDMDALAGNLGTLLPTLTSLQKNMKI